MICSTISKLPASTQSKEPRLVLDCGGKRSATPLWQWLTGSPKAVSPLRSATAVQNRVPCWPANGRGSRGRCWRIAACANIIAASIAWPVKPGFATPTPRPAFSCAQTEVSDELELIPTFAIALSGCDLRCDFCITGGPSWNPRAGEPVRVKELVERADAALANGARTVMILGGEPTIHLPAVLEIVAALPDDAKLVWKTNAHGSAQARELLDGMFDVWLADFKFGNDDCARRLAKAPDYVRVVRENLLWANEHSELIVRHLADAGACRMLLAAGGGMAGGGIARRQSEFAFRLLAGVAGGAAP